MDRLLTQTRRELSYPWSRRGKRSTKDLNYQKVSNLVEVIYFELVSPDSNVSIEFVRVEPYDDNSFRGKNVLITEVKFVLDLSTRL